MTRATSKASFLEEKEKGNTLSQEDRILEIISLGGDISLQEIMAIYRGKHGNIELSSVSARCNKLKADDKVFEGSPRKCAISGKTINPLYAERQRTMGEWNAYVEKGKTKEERNVRLNAVPENMKEQVKAHVVTCFKLRAVK